MIKIAIQGHPIRGAEVIKTLKSLGGNNTYITWGYNPNSYYYITTNNNITYIPIARIKDSAYRDFKLYTLEDFEKEFPFKVGNKIFHNGNKATIEMFVPRETCYYIRYENPPIGPNYTKWVKTSELEPVILQFGDIVLCNNLKGEIIYRKAELDYYGIKVLSGEHSGKFIYTLRNDIKLMKEERNITLTLDKAKEWYNKGGELREIALQAFNIKELTVYPKTYEECINILGGAAIIDIITYYYGKQLNALYKLLICRDAYWKIAGEEMELGKSWEPDWTSLDYKYTIHLKRGEIVKGVGIDRDTILTFPTKEMRDAFYESFKDLIEQCKELL